MREHHGNASLAPSLDDISAQRRGLITVASVRACGLIMKSGGLREAQKDLGQMAYVLSSKHNFSNFNATVKST